MVKLFSHPNLLIGFYSCYFLQGFSPQTVKALIDAGADPNIRARTSGETALQVAIRFDAPVEVIKYLITKTNVNSEDKEGIAAIHTAIIAKRSLDVIEDLMRAGAKLDLHDEPVADVLKDDEYMIDAITQMKAKFEQRRRAAIIMGVSGEGDGQVARTEGFLDEEEEADDVPIRVQTEEQVFSLFFFENLTFHMEDLLKRR